MKEKHINMADPRIEYEGRTEDGVNTDYIGKEGGSKHKQNRDCHKKHGGAILDGTSLPGQPS